MRDDIEFNIKFCELVENHPELYDYNQSSYSNRSVQDKAWELIAQELNESATDCKERWKNIRGRYAKVLKAQVLPSGSATTRIKGYYLGPHLRFLNNFMKSRPPKSNIKAPVMSDDDNNTSGVESNSSLPKPTEGNSASLVSDYMPSTSSTPVIKNPPTLKDVHKSAYEFFSAKKQTLNKKTDSTDSELDLCFLKSVLPDMMAMTPLQKRRFKIGVLNLSFNILAENENITSTRARSESPFSRPYSGSSTYSNSCPPIYTETFQQNSETTAQQNSETTTQQNSETTTQQNSETTTQQNSETTSNQDANVVPITTDTSRTTEAQNFYFLPQYSVISSVSSQPPQSNDDLDLFQL